MNSVPCIKCESCKNYVRQWDGKTWHTLCKMFPEMEIDLYDNICEEFKERVVKAN